MTLGRRLVVVQSGSFQRLNRESTESTLPSTLSVSCCLVHFNGSTERALKVCSNPLAVDSSLVHFNGSTERALKAHDHGIALSVALVHFNGSTERALKEAMKAGRLFGTARSFQRLNRESTES